MEIKRCYDTLIGASVASNQLVQNGDFADGETGWSKSNATVTVSNGVYSATMTASGGYACRKTIYMLANHKYLVMISIKGASGVNYAFNSELPVTAGSGSWQNVSGIKAISTSGNHYFLIGTNETENFAEFSVKNVMYIDLTTELGSAIADYIYSLETATAGSGIAKLREWGFLRGYQAYNAGSIESVEVTGKVVRGFNQWDEEWELGGYADATGGTWNTTDRIRSKANNYIPILPNTNYFFKAPASINVYWYDADKNYIGTDGGYSPNTVHMTPSNAHYMRFALYAGITTYNHDICINLSNPDRNGEYEPYTEQTYDYGDDTLNGIFKLDANNQLYADGDRKTSDGTITRHYGTRAYQSGDESLADAITDGTTTVYKLTTPTTEQSTPFPSPQVCYPDGTEEYVTSNGVPVGHETRYEL